MKVEVQACILILTLNIVEGLYRESAHHWQSDI